MRVLITGGTGQVGRFLTRDLISAGHEVILLGGRPPAPELFPGLAGFVHWRLGDPVAPPPAAALVHAAFDHVPGAYRGGEGDDAGGFWRRNFDGSARLFDAAAGQGIRRLVFLSSRAAYGEGRAGETLREEDAVAPETLYGQLKHATEQNLSRLGAQGLAPVSLRITGVFGAAPGRADHKWRGLFARYLAGERVEPRVATEVHGADVAAAVRLTLERPDVTGLLNVSDILLDRHDLLARVRTLTGCAHPPPPRADPAALAVMATDRLEALGWRPAGLARLAADLPALIAAAEPARA